MQLLELHLFCALLQIKQHLLHFSYRITSLLFVEWASKLRSELLRAVEISRSFSIEGFCNDSVTVALTVLFLVLLVSAISLSRLVGGTIQTLRQGGHANFTSAIKIITHNKKIAYPYPYFLHPLSTPASTPHILPSVDNTVTINTVTINLYSTNVFLY